MKPQLEQLAHMYGGVLVDTKKQRRKRQKLLLVELLFDYAHNSTLHGLRYIVAKTLHIIEKLFWLIIFIASITACALCIYNLYVKWKMSPVIVTVNEQLISAGTVPFPSLTICPRIKCKQSIYNYTKQFMNLYYPEKENGTITELRLTAEEIRKFSHISAVCDLSESIEESNGNNYTITNTSLVNDITEVSLTARDIFFYCEWSNLKINCSELFKRVYTNEGVCYTANSLAAYDFFHSNSTQREYSYIDSDHPIVGWSFETGYSDSEDIPYPRRGQVLSTIPDMDIRLTQFRAHRDTMCNFLYTGYKIYLHHPADFPQSSMYSYLQHPDQDTSIAINFHQLSTDPRLSKYSPEVRQCYYPSERQLRYFKIYTAKNCQTECLSNYTYKTCKCVEFYMPHNNSNELCDSNNQDCVLRAKVEMARNETKADRGLLKKECNCLPACNYIEYDAEVLSTKYGLLSESERQKPDTEWSKITLFFKKPKFVTMQRRELFGELDFLAQVGGLLGLFLGFSILSIVEIFYFLTLRVGFALKRDSEEEKLKMSDTKSAKAMD